MEGVKRIRPGRFFAEFSVRMVVFWLDLLVIVIVSQIIKDHVLVPASLSVDGIGAVFPFVGFFYFVASWSSLMRATPVQWLFGMRIVNSRGSTLRPFRASLRAAGLIGLFFVTFTFFGSLDSPLFAGLALAGYAALFLAAVTPNRQAAHDLLADSVVVNKAAIKAFDEIAIQRRPSIWKMIGDGLVLAVPLVALLIAAQVHQQRDLVYRTSYAVGQTQGLKSAVRVFYGAEQRWPENERELGAATRGDYRDGGYYELEGDGVIRISFEVKAELVRGQIILSPSIGEEGVSWECRQEGDIQQNFLPVACRDREDR